MTMKPSAQRRRVRTSAVLPLLARTAAATAFVLALGVSIDGIAASADTSHARTGKTRPPEISTMTPVPGQDIGVWGLTKQGGDGERVELQRKRGSQSWVTVASRRTSKGGSYSFHTRASAKVTSYRVVGGGGTTLPVTTRPITAARFWELNEECRGTSGPAGATACAQRDNAVLDLGEVASRDFAAAWKARNAPRMRSLASPDTVVRAALGWRLSKTAPDCSFDASVPSWWCYVQGLSGDWTGFRAEVTRYEPGILPVWRVTAAGAPDV